MAVTNGTITKRILKAAKTMEAGPALRNAFIGHLDSFPLSSNNLVYDEDKNKMSSEKWELLMEVCVGSDKAKFEASERWFKKMGAKMSGGLPYGRYNG